MEDFFNILESFYKSFIEFRDKIVIHLIFNDDFLNILKISFYLNLFYMILCIIDEYYKNIYYSILDFKISIFSFIWTSFVYFLCVFYKKISDNAINTRLSLKEIVEEFLQKDEENVENELSNLKEYRDDFEDNKEIEQSIIFEDSEEDFVQFELEKKKINQNVINNLQE